MPSHAMTSHDMTSQMHNLLHLHHAARTYREYDNHREECQHPRIISCDAELIEATGAEDVEEGVDHTNQMTTEAPPRVHLTRTGGKMDMNRTWNGRRNTLHDTHTRYDMPRRDMPRRDITLKLPRTFA